MALENDNNKNKSKPDSIGASETDTKQPVTNQTSEVEGGTKGESVNGSKKKGSLFVRWYIKIIVLAYNTHTPLNGIHPPLFIKGTVPKTRR